MFNFWTFKLIVSMNIILTYSYYITMIQCMTWRFYSHIIRVNDYLKILFFHTVNFFWMLWYCTYLLWNFYGSLCLQILYYHLYMDLSVCITNVCRIHIIALVLFAFFLWRNTYVVLCICLWIKRSASLKNVFRIFF